MEVWRACVPHRDAVRARVGEVEICCGPRRVEEHGGDRSLAQPGARYFGAYGLQELQLFRVAQNCPRQTARPGAEWGITLLRVRASMDAVIDIENALMGDAAPDIVRVAALAVIDAVAGRDFRVLQQPLQK